MLYNSMTSNEVNANAEGVTNSSSMTAMNNSLTNVAKKAKGKVRLWLFLLDYYDLKLCLSVKIGHVKEKKTHVHLIYL